MVPTNWAMSCSRLGSVARLLDLSGAQHGALQLATADGGLLLLPDEVLDGLGRPGRVAMHVGDGRGARQQFVQTLHAGVGGGDLAKGVLHHLEIGVDLAQALAQFGGLGEREPR